MSATKEKEAANSTSGTDEAGGGGEAKVGLNAKTHSGTFKYHYQHQLNIGLGPVCRVMSTIPRAYTSLKSLVGSDIYIFLQYI